MTYVRHEPFWATPPKHRNRVSGVSRGMPITEDQPDIGREDGVLPPRFELQLTRRQKLARAAVIGLFVVIGALFGFTLV